MSKLIKEILLVSLIVLTVSCVNIKQKEKQVKITDIVDNETIISILNLVHDQIPNKSFQKTRNPDIDFIVSMIPHHQGVIISSEEFIKIGTDRETKMFAQAMIDLNNAELSELNEMSSYLYENPKDYSDTDYLTIGDVSEDIMKRAMHNMVNINFVSDINIDYLLAMIEHQRGIADAYQVIFNGSKDKRVKDLADRIISSQKAEIRQMTMMVNELKATHKQSKE